MCKVFSVIFFFMVSCVVSRAQVFIINDNLTAGRLAEVEATVIDSLTNDPVAFASVYVIPVKDTSITNFTLSDAEGKASLEGVPFGEYVFHVEMLGYKPFVVNKYFRDRNVDMGTIKLQINENYLKAAMVTDVGNPIIVKKDTVEFNASSFQVGANAMLKDLLMRMPGMEITDEGKVKFNGEVIDKLTVGGRTFFFDDQSTALNNLPAAIVDKIRVIDRESEQTRASGIQDGNREKMMDVALKKEYENGLFGNVGLKGGTTLGEKDRDDLRDNRGVLWNENALLSAYSEKDQITVIANGLNIMDNSNMVVAYIDDEGEEHSSSDQGLSTAAQLGVNVNTSRIKDVETTASVNYRYADTDSGTKVGRTTYRDDGNMFSTTENSGKSYVNGLSTNMEFKKEKGNVWFHIRPSLRFNKANTYVNNASVTSRDSWILNSSENAVHSLSENKITNFNSDVTFRQIGGKKNRTLRLAFNPSYSDNSGESVESSFLATAAGKDSRAMTYHSKGLSYGFDGSIRFSEPIGKKLTLSTMMSLGWSRRNNVRDAFDAAGRNDFYSTESRTNFMQQQYDLTVQYRIGQSSYILLGGRAIGVLNETFSKSYGIEDITGKDDWDWFFKPMFRFQHNKNYDQIVLAGSGLSRRPSNSRMLPVLDISNSSRLSLGNIYLKPYTMTAINANWMRNNPKSFSTLMAFVLSDVTYDPIVSALWYDGDGILYSVPVNATKPSLSASLVIDYTFPLDVKKHWSLTMLGAPGYSSSISYQARTTLPSLDKDNFDYSAFMADFWGNSNGSRFYGGQSGFGESKTQSINMTEELYVKYNKDRLFFSAGASSLQRIARYSLNPRANMNTMDTRITVRGSYTTKNEYEFNSDIHYVFYKGYSAGYGQPEWQWNAGISKNIKAFNLSVIVHDILDQTHNLTHTVTADYEEDSYRLIMGRYILFGVKWNFGKMNEAHSQRAQQVARDMVY